MQETANVVKYDVVIVGAGPAGCACALALKDKGLSVAIIDKASFPRDKVCGDAIPYRAVKVLRGIDPSFENAFKIFPKKQEIKKTTVYYKNKQLAFEWTQEAYTCTRMEFDHFLFSLVQQQTGTTIYTDTQPEAITIAHDHARISLKGSNTILEARLLIGCDGAHSVVAKQLTNKTMDRKHHVGSVRAYYTNVANIDAQTNGIYFEKRFLPSYLWIFPLPDNSANVGFGMLSSEIAKRKVNLKNAFYDFIEQTPDLKEKFDVATQTSTLEGFGLPLGSKKITISGDHFMLAGDAASLIDPITGEGIGNAMLSGKLAAEQAVSCMARNNYTAAFMHSYDKVLNDMLGAELKNRYRAQRLLFRMPALLDIIFFVCRNKAVHRLIQKTL